MMRTLLYFTFFTVVIISGVKAQDDFVADNVSFVMAEKQEKPSEGDVFYANDDLIYAGSFSSSIHLRRINAQTMGEDWNIKMKSNFKFEKIKFKIDTAIITSDGVVNLIGPAVNKKTKELVIGVTKISKDGKEVGKDILTTVPRVYNKNDYRFKLVHSNDKYHVIAVVAGITAHKNDREVFVVWLDQNLMPVAMQETGMTDDSDILDAYGYDDNNDILYFTTHDVKVAINGVYRKPKIRFLYSIPLEESKKPSRVLLDFEKTRLFSHEVRAHPKTGEVILVSLGGPAKTNNINGFFITRFEPYTLKDIGGGYYPFSESLVNQIKDSRKILDALFTGNKTVFFKNPIVHFTSEGGFFAVFEDISENLHRGQLLLRFDESQKLEWQTYVPNYGYGGSVSLLDKQENLLIYSVSQCKYMNKTYPSLDIYNNPSRKCYSAVKYILSPKGKLELLPLANFSERSVLARLSLVKLHEDYHQIFINHQSPSFGSYRMLTRKITEKL